MCPADPPPIASADTVAVQRTLVPRDAATLVVIDCSGREPRVLMGRRRDDLAFLPGKYVFPGGRVDPADRIGRTDLLAPAVAEKLLLRQRGSPSLSRAHALARTAIRETFEETGLRVGQCADEVLPKLAFLARAVTPPGRVRRFDTRFFLADASLINEGSELGGDGELSRLDWFRLEEMRRLDLPGITRLVVEDIAQFQSLEPHRSAWTVPYYFQRSGRFQRDLL